MVGKLTRDDICTSSIVCALFDESKFFSKQEALDRCIRSKNGENTRFVQNNRQRTGDLLEPVLIQEACNRLGLTNVNADVDYKVSHPFLPLEASLDGIAEADNLLVSANEDIGVYLPHASNYKMNGKVVIECKCTSTYPNADEPPKYLGVLQLQSSMEILDADYGVLIVLYQSTDLRIYVYKRNPEFADQLKEKVEDFDRRVKEEDYYPPNLSADAYIMHKQVEDDENELILDAEAVDDIDEYMTYKKLAKQAEETADVIHAKIMMHMGNYSKARAANYKLTWNMTNFKARPEKVIPAKEAYSLRRKTITIKDVG
tara:strand:- start:3711 stop:4655 length:945 start_codon:yes stop_codon:yes gene_type:complete